MLAELLTSENVIALLTLTSLEVVLGIDNLVFISILAGKLPEELRQRARAHRRRLFAGLGHHRRRYGRSVAIMVIAVMLAIAAMMVFSKRIGEFVEQHPTIKMLALSFLILLGTILVAEGFDQHIPKGYVYFAMAFSLGVELLNMKVRKTRQTVAGSIFGTDAFSATSAREPQQ
jgi:predicted tellurium resistance membrane protein TerC